jgi:hypothetical protein
MDMRPVMDFVKLEQDGAIAHNMIIAASIFVLEVMSAPPGRKIGW